MPWQQAPSSSWALESLIPRTSSSAAPPAGDVAQAFKRLAPAVVRIEVRETGAVALSSVGSGFFAAPSGRIITNYHVISRLVNEPERHRGRATWGSDTVDIQVLAVDVVHDLAVLEAPGRARCGHADAGHRQPVEG